MRTFQAAAPEVDQEGLLGIAITDILADGLRCVLDGAEEIVHE